MWSIQLNVYVVIIYLHQESLIPCHSQFEFSYCLFENLWSGIRVKSSVLNWKKFCFSMTMWQEKNSYNTVVFFLWWMLSSLRTVHHSNYLSCLPIFLIERQKNSFDLSSLAKNILSSFLFGLHILLFI